MIFLIRAKRSGSLSRIHMSIFAGLPSLFLRPYAVGHWTSASIRNHGITVGWDLVLVNGWGRLGADPEWNKASDALMLLYWPGVDEMGKRRWKAVRDKLADALDPRSEGHRRLVKDKRGARDEFRIDMDPRHGADA